MTMRTTMTRALRGLVTATALALFPALAFPTSAQAAGAAPAAPAQSWNHAGLFGTFDRGAQQRGFQVYKEVCAACHGMNLEGVKEMGGAALVGGRGSIGTAKTKKTVEAIEM